MTRPLKSQLIETQDYSWRLIHSLISGFVSPSESPYSSFRTFSVIDWKNRLLFAAANDFPLGEKWLQHEADPHLLPVVRVRMLRNLSPFLLNAFIT